MDDEKSTFSDGEAPVLHEVDAGPDLTLWERAKFAVARFVSAIVGGKWVLAQRPGSGCFRSIEWVECFGKFIAVGDGGALAVSADGKKWTPFEDQGAANLYAVAVNQASGLFVAVGKNGAMYASIDFRTLDRIASPTSLSLTSIAFDGKTWIAGGILGVLLKSRDGQTWSMVKSGTGAQINSLAPMLGGFLAACSGGVVGTCGADLVFSWQRVPATNLYAAGFFNGVSLVGGKDGAVFRSTNGGKAWTKIDAGPVVGKSYFMEFRKAAGIIFSCGNADSPMPDGKKCSAALWSGDDGLTWNRDATPDYSSMVALAVNGTVVVMGGTRSAIMYANLSDWGGVTPPPVKKKRVTVTKADAVIFRQDFDVDSVVDVSIV